MFLKYLEPIFRPWRAMRNKIIQVRTVKGNINAEKRRVQRFGNVAKQQTGKARGHMTKAQAEAQKVQGQAQQMGGQAQQMGGQAQQMGGAMPQGMPPAQAKMGAMPQGAPMPAPMPYGMPQGVQMQGQAQEGPGPLNPNPPIKIIGFFRRRKVCTQCTSELDRSWDSCPYCAQAAAAQAPAPGPQKTQAFMLDTSGAGGSVQLLGWLVAIKGPQRGELFTLAPHSVVGTDPTCQIVLTDQYMSSRHVEIKAQGGVWILQDMGSTNGTYVNDRRVDSHELVDNDFIRFGQSVIKFKCL